MLKQRAIFFIGLWVILLPYLGFTRGIKNFLFLITGVSLIVLSYFMYVQIRAIEEREKFGGTLTKDSSKNSGAVTEALEDHDIFEANKIIYNENNNSNNKEVLGNSQN